MHTPYLGRTKGYIGLGKGMRISRKGKGHWLNKATVLRCLISMGRRSRNLSAGRQWGLGCPK